MGYIGTLAGMPVNNIQPAALSECDQDGHETALANRVLQYQRLPLSSGQARAALIIHDLTRQRQLELSLAATLDGIVQVSREKVSLLQILEQIRRYMLQTLLPSARRVTIHVGG